MDRPRVHQDRGLLMATGTAWASDTIDHRPSPMDSLPMGECQTTDFEVNRQQA